MENIVYGRQIVALAPKKRLCAGAAFGRDSLNIYGALSNWRAVAVAVVVYA